MTNVIAQEAAERVRGRFSGDAFGAAARELVKRIAFPTIAWRHHGLGMLQGELADDLRIHIWHPILRTMPKRTISDIDRADVDPTLRDVHDHRFDLVSHVVLGSIFDIPYYVTPHPEGRAQCWTIMHAKGQTEVGGAVRRGCSTATDASDPIRVNAEPQGFCRYFAGETYAIARRHFHTTHVDGLAITVVHRSNFDEGLARVLGPGDGPLPTSGIVRDTDRELISRVLHEANEARVREGIK